MTGSISVLAIVAISQVSDPAADKGWQPVFQRMAEEYVIQSTDEPPRLFELRKSPILRWSQPVRGGDDGATFVWLDRGCPVAIAAIFAYPNEDKTRTVVHEMHSIAPSAMNATYRDRVRWQPNTSGIVMKDFPDATSPAEKASARLAQMRSMLRQFSARSIDKSDKPWELRLMSQPLVRYEPVDRTDLIDGAVFAFAQGTDPEILVVFEAQRNSDKQNNEKTVWKYGCGRFSDYRLEMKHKEQLVWNVPANDFSNQNGVYFATSVEVRQAPRGATDLKDRAPVEPGQ